jgi:ribosome biogenesis GTPase A
VRRAFRYNKRHQTINEQGNMAIQWFPGHMHLTKKAIIERMKTTDVVIELLDARLPGSSSNPLLAELSGNKPKLKILNKQDLADPIRTELWLNHYNALAGTLAIGLDASEPTPAKRLLAACRELAPHRGTPLKPMRVLICGIPNVGKSTLINTLAGKRFAKTGDEAGITKLEQRISLGSDFTLFDTPGMLWPKIIAPKSGYNLAASGAVGRNAFDEEEVSFDLLDYLKRNYPSQIEKRYGIINVANLVDEELLLAIGRKRGALLKGNRINSQKVAEAVLLDFRASDLGRITLETPSEYLSWQASAQLIEDERLRNKKK